VRRGGVTVLAYHAIADLGTDPVLARYAVPPAEFLRQLDTLARLRCRFVGLDDVLAGVTGAQAPPRRAVLLTFDDGYEDLRTTVAPILAERGLPATVFAVTSSLGGSNGWDTAIGACPQRLLSGAELASLPGVTVGSHSRTHADLTRLDDAQLRSEAAGSRTELAAAGLPVPRAFSYPYGRADARAVEAVRAAGYDIAFTLQRGRVRAGADPLRLPRVELHRGDGRTRLPAKLAAAGMG
jgi:peptidoglycan/xylan/chitin deacetylase (PgdA/CDA1 family)